MQDKGEVEKNYYPQIDFIKALAITAVILLHTLPQSILDAIYADFHISQAVPIFVIASGLIGYVSYKTAVPSKFSQLYTKSYFLKKIQRFIVPLLIMYAIDLVYLLFTNKQTTNETVFRIATGQIPTGGPGSFYTSVIIQIILLAPILYYSFSKKPVITIGVMFLVDLAFELLGPYIPYDFYYISIFRYFGAFALGILVADQFRTHQRIQIKRDLFITVLIPFSVAYLLLYRISPIPFFRTEWVSQNFLTAFYALMLVSSVLLIYPHLGNTASKLCIIGKSSYQIFLIQILFFGLGINSLFLITGIPIVMTGLLSIAANITVTFLVGIMFFVLSKKASSYGATTRGRFKF